MQYLLQILLIVQKNKKFNLIHSKALIDSSAEIGSNVKIGPYSIVEANVKIGDDCIIGNHVTICSNTRLGKGCKVFHSSSIGEIPQDLKFEGEITKTNIGDNTIIREYVTINRGTKALGETNIGSGCLLMASTHVAHDCILGDNVIMSNLSTLGGHVELEDWVILGGGVLVHQFTKIGAHAFIGGGFRAVQDVPPFIISANDPLEYKGVNNTGLKRRGYSLDERRLIKNIYKIYFRSGLNRDEALNRINEELDSSNIKDQIVKFIQSSERGVI